MIVGSLDSRQYGAAFEAVSSMCRLRARAINPSDGRIPHVPLKAGYPKDAFRLGSPRCKADHSL
jgi:hypothetical protein